ncbi:hypothetical protein V5O48_012239 [Marasmius crinis-equi]|uniref:Programmed cell death protein 2 C-terminal domain-containing protein n=1 Tax=Marasmius crinis-equi TaxID=585013 RepID=A0ABR3F3A9_9AGAR
MKAAAGATNPFTFGSQIFGDSPAADKEVGDDDKDSAEEEKTYENSLDVDQVFDKFAKRVASEGGQCVRYELDGVPLPFAFDSVFDQLFPPPPKEPLPVTKAEFKVVPDVKRTYTPAVPECPGCGGKRVFDKALIRSMVRGRAPPVKIILKKPWALSEFQGV